MHSPTRQLDPATLLRNIYAQTSGTTSAGSELHHSHTAPSNAASFTQQHSKLIQHASAFQPLPTPLPASAATSSSHTAGNTSSSSSAGVAIPAAVSATASTSYPYAIPPSSSPSLFHRPVPITSAFSAGSQSSSPAPSTSPSVSPLLSHIVDPEDSEVSKRPYKRREAVESSKADSKRQKQHTANNISAGGSQTATPQSAFTAVPINTAAQSTLTSASFSSSTSQGTGQHNSQQQPSAPNTTSSTNTNSSGSQPMVVYPAHSDAYPYYSQMYPSPMQGQVVQHSILQNHSSHSPAQTAQQQQQPQPSQMAQPSSSTLSPPAISSLLAGAPPPLPSSAAVLSSGPVSTIFSISNAANSMQNGVRVYPKYNDLLCCRHMCGCRRSKFDCSKSLPDDQLAKLRQQHHDKLVRAMMRQRPELTTEQAHKEVGDVNYLAGVAIIKRASRTQHEQNAALHTCGQQSDSGKYIDYPCRKLLKSSKPPTKPATANGRVSAAALSPFPAVSGQSAQLADTVALEEVQDEDSLLGLLYGSATKAMLSTRETFVPSSILRFVPPAVLERHHMRGLALPFMQLPITAGSEYLSSYWEGDSAIKLVQMPAEPDRAPRVDKGETSVPQLSDWARLPAAAEHSKLLVASVRSSSSAAGGEPCSIVDVRDHHSRSVGYGHISQFLHQLTVGKHSTYLSTWRPASSDLNARVAKSEQSVDLALHELTKRSNLLRLLASYPNSHSSLPSSQLSGPLVPDMPAAFSPRCTRLASDGYRPFGCSVLFSSAAVRLSPHDTSSVAWLVVSAAHRSRAEAIVAQEARRQLLNDKDVPADLPPSALLVLLYAGLVFIDPTLFIINGVPVHLVQQTAAQLFVHGGDMLLACVVLGGTSVTMYEQPFLPVAWLRDGPTRCQHWLQWVHNALPSDSSEHSPLRHTVRTTVSRIFPEPHSSRLFAAIAADVAAHIAPNSPTGAVDEHEQKQQDESGPASRAGAATQSQCVMDYYSLSESELRRALDSLAACQAALAQWEW